MRPKLKSIGGRLRQRCCCCWRRSLSVSVHSLNYSFVNSYIHTYIHKSAHFRQLIRVSKRYFASVTARKRKCKRNQKLKCAFNVFNHIHTYIRTYIPTAFIGTWMVRCFVSSSQFFFALRRFHCRKTFVLFQLDTHMYVWIYIILV